MAQPDPLRNALSAIVNLGEAVAQVLLTAREFIATLRAAKILPKQLR
jgi:hypothetical protein